MKSVVKSQELNDGAMLRIFEENSFKFMKFKFKNWFYVLKEDYELYEPEMSQRDKGRIHEN